MAITVNSIYYYPIKGLGGTALTDTTVSESGLPFDRRFGIAYTDTLPAADETYWRPWNYFVSLKRQPQAFRLRAAAKAEGDGVILTLYSSDGSRLSGNPHDNKERRTLEDFIRAVLQLPQLRLIDSRANPLWDEQGMVLSLMNTNSITDLATTANQPLAAARFRANILFAADAWGEDTWGEHITIGKVRLKQVSAIPRCKATELNPDNGEYDCKPPQLLIKHRGRNSLGLYTILAGGSGEQLARGMEIIPDSAE